MVGTFGLGVVALHDVREDVLDTGSGAPAVGRDHVPLSGQGELRADLCRQGAAPGTRGDQQPIDVDRRAIAEVHERAATAAVFQADDLGVASHLDTGVTRPGHETLGGQDGIGVAGTLLPAPDTDARQIEGGEPVGQLVDAQGVGDRPDRGQVPGGAADLLDVLGPVDEQSAGAVVPGIVAAGDLGEAVEQIQRLARNPRQEGVGVVRPTDRTGAPGRSARDVSAFEDDGGDAPIAEVERGAGAVHPAADDPDVDVVHGSSRKARDVRAGP